MENMGIILEQITRTELRDIVSEAVRTELERMRQEQLGVEELPELMTRQQVSEFLHVSLVCLYHWDRSGKLCPVKLNSRVRYKKTDVLNFLAGGQVKYRRSK
jgi:hypothetical protein